VVYCFILGYEGFRASLDRQYYCVGRGSTDDGRDAGTSIPVGRSQLAEGSDSDDECLRERIESQQLQSHQLDSEEPR